MQRLIKAKRGIAAESHGCQSFEISHRYTQLEPAIFCCMRIECDPQAVKHVLAFALRYEVLPCGQKAKPNKTMPEECRAVSKTHWHSLCGAAHGFEASTFQQREGTGNRRAVRNMRVKSLYTGRIE